MVVINAILKTVRFYNLLIQINFIFEFDHIYTQLEGQTLHDYLDTS
jgi:hypothetical protein